MKYINLEDKSLSELIELRDQFSGTNTFGAIDRAFKYVLSEPYFRMIEHCKKRDCPKIKKFYLRSNSFR
ncbi:MAG: hypothetical protein ACM3O4_03895 [Ignavibacteriales bacterium]